MKGFDLQEDQLLTAAEVAEILKVTVRTVMNYKAKKLIRYCQIGRALRFKTSDVQAFIESFMVEPLNAQS